MGYKENFSEIIQDLTESKPLVHHITNYVTAADCAAVALAAGASAVMADFPDEVAQITKKADALVLNLGTFSASRKEAMLISAKAAKEEDIPVVMDPVGVMSSRSRLEFATELLKKGYITIVRGNFSECRALLEDDTAGRGVDSEASGEDAMVLYTAKNLAEKYGCVVALTGAKDYISDGTRVLALKNGHIMSTKITGAGCMATTLVACCAAVTQDTLSAAALGTVIIGQAAELAAGLLEKKDGPGMFKVRLIDSVYHVVTRWNVIMDRIETVRQN